MILKLLLGKLFDFLAEYTPMPVRVKRKQEFKHSYQEEYISIHKIIETLKLLVKFRHPDYRFLTEEMINSYESACLAELVEESSDSE